MSLESISWYSDKTGMTRVTVKKRLETSGIASTHGAKSAILYDTKDALPALYGRESLSNQGDLMSARAENLRADTRIKELKEQQLRRELAPIVVLEYALSSLCAQVSAILDSIAPKLKRRLPQLTAADIDIIRSEIAKARNAAATIELEFDSGSENNIAEYD
ncbi:terminase small subunit [Rhodoferax sp. 4810]|uniref:Terminase small subunit n=1 Tax=Thiospirillum jenense TaxID=1653858 RepID=A0A839HE64_9GAMM|nr:terminase small subunit [Thiospirillum jenense]MBB1074480.1 terminase small subunit [Rhodoferax jenense]MBB1125538.1 terminase small subunit [Thiospirillum jenense]